MTTVCGAILVGVLWGSGPDLKEGSTAPGFALPDQDGKIHKLFDYRGQKVVVYFYPKDDTPGCVKEACSFRDNFSTFQASKIQVFGISYDSPDVHRNFREKYGLPFTLFSDSNGEVTKAYGADGLSFPKRMTFLIDEDGRIIRIYDKVTVTTHGQDILRYFSSFGTANK